MEYTLNQDARRWARWNRLVEKPGICPANAYSVVFSEGDTTDARIDATCRRDFAANGVCWCGKLRDEQLPMDMAR